MYAERICALILFFSFATLWGGSYWGAPGAAGTEGARAGAAGGDSDSEEDGDDDGKERLCMHFLCMRSVYVL